MSREIVVPQVSDGVTSGTVISLAVAEGDEVSADQTLLELETEKAVVAIPSPVAGTIREVRVREGDEARVGAVIMLLDADTDEGKAGGEEKPQSKAEESAAAVPKKGEEQVSEKAADATGEKAEAQEDNEPDLRVRRTGDEVAPAAPVVRRIARELGVDIHQVAGSGPGGRISEKDVRRYVRTTMEQVAGSPAAVAAGPGSKPLPDFSAWGDIERKPLSRVRQVTAEAMSRAWSTVPMVTQYDRAEVDGLEAFRQQYNGQNPEEKLTMTAILLKVCAVALKGFPQFNTSLDSANKELIYKKYIHIGVAVDTPGGLLVPVVRDVDSKGLATIAAELNQLAEKTRERKIAPADMEGGTFTISNLGGIGGTAFTPIVYAPQVAILGVSRTEVTPVWDGSAFVPRQMLPLSLTYDHRVIDGADGARFLRFICEALEQPLQLVM